MEWVAEWNEIDVSKGMSNATFTGPRRAATIILDGDWYITIVGTPGRGDYDHNSLLTLSAAKEYLRRTQSMPPYTRFKRQS